MISRQTVEHFLQTEMGIGQTTWLLTAAAVVVGSAECHALVLKSSLLEVVGRLPNR